MPAQLVALSEGPSIVLDKQILLIGRHPECDIQIESRKISRRHCCIAQVNNYLVVRDLGSTNGIRINGVRALEGRLTTGDELTIGNRRYQVYWEDAPESPNIARVRPRAAPAASMVREAEDVLLESCDVPVPLDELPLRKAQPLAPPSPVPEAKDPDSPGGTVGEQAPLVLPENLELMPLSDMNLNLSGGHSDSPPAS
jgi:predicted component of type VI protein secretion system